MSRNFAREILLCQVLIHEVAGDEVEVEANHIHLADLEVEAVEADENDEVAEVDDFLHLRSHPQQQISLLQVSSRVYLVTSRQTWASGMHPRLLKFVEMEGYG